MLNARPTWRRLPSIPIVNSAPVIGAFRYRTALFVGAWRDHSEEAVDDAVRAGQAKRGAPGRLEIRWLVKGSIETRVGSDPAEVMPKAQ